MSKSTWERIKEEKIKAGQYHVLPESTNIKIMQELNSSNDFSTPVKNYSVTITGFKSRMEVINFLEKHVHGFEPEDCPKFFPEYLSFDKEMKSFRTNLNKHNFDVDIKVDYSKEDNEFKDIEL